MSFFSGLFDSTTTNQPSAQSSAQLSTAWDQAQQAAQAPYTPYKGQLVAPLNSGQTTAIGQLQGSYGLATPYMNAASTQYGNAGASLGNVNNYLSASSGALGKVQGYMDQASQYATPQSFDPTPYMNPYQKSVIDATMAWANQNNAQQMSGLVSNSIGSGAYGGDRNGIAVGTLAGQQAMANDSTVAGLNAANYAQATQQWNQMQADRFQAAGIYGNLGQQEGQIAQQYGTLGSLALNQGTAQGNLAGVGAYLGSAAQQSAIQGASAGLQGSTLQQNYQQQLDAARQGMYQQAQAYPFQTAGFISNVANGQAANLGGSTTGSTSPFGAALSVGQLGLGVMNNASGVSNNILPNWGRMNNNWRGGRITLGDAPARARGGSVTLGDVPQFARGGGLSLPHPLTKMAGLGGIDVLHPAMQRGIVPKNIRHLRPHFDDGGLITFNPTAGTPYGGGFDPTASNPMFENVRTSGGGAGGAGGSHMPSIKAPSNDNQGLGALASDPAPGLGSPPSIPSSGGEETGALGLSKNAGQALMVSGLAGLAAGPGNSGLSAVGQGGLAGMKFYNSLQQQDASRAFQQQEMSLKEREFGLSARHQDFEENQARLLLQGVQESAKVYAGGTSTAAGVAPAGASTSPTGGAASGVSAPAGSIPAGPSGAPASIPSGAPSTTSPTLPAATGVPASPMAGPSPVSQPSPMSGPAPSQGAAPAVDPNWDPRLLSDRIRRAEQAAAVAGSYGNQTVMQNYSSTANALRSRMENIMRDGTVQMADGTVGKLPGWVEAAAQTEAARTAAQREAEQRFTFQTAFDQNGNETKLDTPTYRALIASGGTATIGGRVVTATQNPMLQGQKQGYEQWNTNAIAYEKDAPEAQQRIKALADIYAIDATSGSLADRFAQLDSFARQFGVGSVLQNQRIGNDEASYDAAKKLVSDAAMHKVGEDGVGRAPGVALKMAALTQADPAMAPAARFSVLARTQAGLQYDGEMNAYVHDSKTTDIYQAQREFARTHSMDDYVRRAALTLPAPAGATPENLKAAGLPPEAALPKPATPAQAAQLRPGTAFVDPDGVVRHVPMPNGGSTGRW